MGIFDVHYTEGAAGLCYISKALSRPHLFCNNEFITFIILDMDLCADGYVSAQNLLSWFESDLFKDKKS